MSDRPSWMPSWLEIDRASCADFLIDGEKYPNLEVLIERAALKAQIEVLEAIPTSDPVGFNPADAEVHELLINRRARLAELEEK